MTSTLLPGLLKATSRNVGRGASGVALFEATTVTFANEGQAAPIYGVDRRPTPEELDALEAAIPRQPQHVAVVVAGERERAGWWGPGRVAGWEDAIAAIQSVGAALGVQLHVRAAELAPWHPGRCAEFVAGDTVIGHGGELHPKVCTAFGVPPRTSAAEIDLDLLMDLAVDVVGAPTFSSFPVAKEDVALIVDADVPSADVEAALRAGAGDLLESIHLFDVYTGDQIGAGKKSLAFALRFRAPDRTLKEGESVTARDAAVAAAVERCGAVQRS